MQNVQRIVHAPIVGDHYVAIDLDGDHNQRQDNRHRDEEIADLEHRPLCVTDGAGPCDQLGCPPEERIGACSDRHAVHLALLDDTAGVGFVSLLLGDRKGFAGECRPFDGSVVARHQPKMMTKSSQRPRKAETNAAASIMKAIGPMKYLTIFSAIPTCFSGSALGPYCACRRATSALSRPFSTSTPSLPSTSVTGIFQDRRHLIARFGAPRIVTAGLVTLGLAGVVALTVVTLSNFHIALILLGLGWNFGFVGATSLLAMAHAPHKRGRIQGLNDMMVFGCVTFASLASGGLMNCSGRNPVEGWNAVNTAMIPFLLLAGAALIWLLRQHRTTRIGA